MNRRLHIASPTPANFSEAEQAFSGWRMGDKPTSRLENGLHIAIEWTRRDDVELDAKEEQRLQSAIVRILAREASGHAEPAVIGSVDYARMLVVDAALQREAETGTQLDILDRRERFSWANPEMNHVAWVRTDTSPTELISLAEADLAALAAGRYDEISVRQRQIVEVMLLRGASPREDRMERELHQVDALLSRGEDGIGKGEFGPKANPVELARQAEQRDLDRFGSVGRVNELSQDEMRGLVDRLALAQIADVHKEGSGSLYDDRPGRNPFKPDASKDGLQYATVTAVKSGRISNRLERSVRIAFEFQQERGVVLDRPAMRRMESAVMRFVSSRDNRGVSEMEVVKALIVDTAIQRVAAEKLAQKPMGFLDASYERTASEVMLEEMLGRGSYPVFTKLKSERAETEAVAQGRFQDLTDARGIGSAVRTAIYRSGRHVGGDLGAQLDRIARANPLGKPAAPGWIRNVNEKAQGRQLMRSLAKGPQASQPTFKIEGLSR